jgi:hypothetical protein
MVKMLQDFEAINRLTLMGCNTASSLVLDEEVKIADRFKREFTEHSDCAFATMSVKPDNFAKYIEGFKQNSAYFLVKSSKTGKDASYKLYYVSWEAGHHHKYTVKHFNLNQEGLSIVKHIISPHGRGFKFPKDDNMNILRGTKSKTVQPNMTLHEFLVLNDACHNRDRSNKNSHQYKEYKKIAAFLANVTIEGDEVIKLQDSLLKKLVMEIEESDISRKIIVKGYTCPVYVDTAEQRLHGSKASLYKNRDYPNSFFNSREDNIDRDKLKTDRTSFITKMRKEATDKQITTKPTETKLSKVKSIKVVTSGKK